MVREYGLREGINEVIGITIADWINTAPLGIIVDGDVKVRLFENHTREFVKKTGILYVNVIHDPVVFVISAFEDLSEDFFESVNPPILRGALSWIKFKADLRGRYAYLEPLDGGVLRRELRAVNRGFKMTLRDGITYERDLFALSISSDDAREGLKAFVEKREAKFKKDRDF